jgi:hypothetical protein
MRNDWRWWDVMRFIRYDRGYWLDEYFQYLKDDAEKFPAGAREFALAPWHYEMAHQKSPHDSWLEYFDIKELSSGKRNEVRVVEIRARYLGSHHDGHFTLIYRSVSSYSMEFGTFKRGGPDRGHGDWIIDEITIDEENNVHHEIHFSEGGEIKICCADLEYRWEPR